MFDTVKKYTFYLKNFAFRPRSIAFYHEFRREAQLPEDERRQLIFDRLQHIVKTAWDNSPFYRRKYGAVGMTDGIIRSMADFEQLPTLEKNELREYADEIVNRSIPARRRRPSTTGGSTGVPVKVFHDRKLPLDAIGWYVLEQFGGDISENAAFLMRYNPHQRKLPINQIAWFPTRRCFLDVTCITEERWFDFYRRCRGISPRYLMGYVGAVEEFASFLERHSLSVPSVRFVWTTAAPLSDSARLNMEKTFNCPVYNQYGCCEIFWLACECRLKHFHYFDTIRHFEVLNEQQLPVPDGEYGDLAVTDMLNEVFPLIRYRNGDRIKKLTETCSCGSGFPLIDKVNGRTTDIIQLKGGGCVPGDFLTTIFDHRPDAVSGFQVVQHRDCSITLKYIPESDDSAEVVSGVCQRLNKLFHGTPVSAEIVQSIPNDRGKSRFVIRDF